MIFVAESLCREYFWVPYLASIGIYLQIWIAVSRSQGEAVWWEDLPWLVYSKILMPCLVSLFGNVQFTHHYNFLRIHRPKYQLSKMWWCKWFCNLGTNISCKWNFADGIKYMDNRYFATANKESNVNYLGPAPLEEMARYYVLLTFMLLVCYLNCC